MRIRLSFDQDPDGRFVLLAEARDSTSVLHGGAVTVKSFDHEDLFLQVLMETDLDFAAIAAVAGAVLKAVADPSGAVRSVEVELTRDQYARLGLADGDLMETDGNRGTGKLDPFGFASQFHDFLMQAPTPFVMLSGPEHRFTFINPPYLRLIGRSSHEGVIGKPVRKVLPELEGQPFFELLDGVYRSGVPYIGIEIQAYMRNRQGTGMEDRYFDFIYHPVRSGGGGSGPVAGILVLATDVTERVLAQQMTEEREEKLYHQWAELEAIYLTVPLGLAVFDVREFRVLRINPLQAEWMKGSEETLVGKSLGELSGEFPVGRQMLERVAGGESIRNKVVGETGEPAGGTKRRWLLNMSPLRGAAGRVEAVTSIMLELTGMEALG